MSDMFKDKDVINLPDNYKDDRGFIQPICDLNMKSASLIISKKILGELTIIIKLIGILFMF